jgi:hypothetical protein
MTIKHNQYATSSPPATGQDALVGDMVKIFVQWKQCSFYQNNSFNIDDDHISQKM